MANYLVIVESPAKAKTINKYLGKNYTVIASMGHMRDLPKSQLGIDLENGYEPKYITIRGKGDLMSKLKKAAKAADKIYLATDPDREGEAISWHLANILDIDTTKNCRITFNEVTKSAVTASLKAARPIDENLVDAQQARRVLDRIVGYKISPILWKKVKKGLSAGRVQSAATKLVVDREREINSFEPKEYWTLTAALTQKGERKSIQAKFYGVGSKKKELRSFEETAEILSKVENSPFVVKSASYSEKKQQPSPPFTTSTLQQEASRKLGFTSRRTMSAAQQLYEGVAVPGKGTLGLITYMRTDSLRITPDAQESARGIIAEKYGKEYMPNAPRNYKTGKNAQDAHEAIRPTVAQIEPDMIKGAVSADLYKIYKLIWERFIASQMSNAVYNTLSAEFDANGCTFRAAARTLQFAGYRAVYIDGSEEDSEKEEKRLPALEEGMSFTSKEIEKEQHFTEPPARYTEASLIKTMEENGIGRPSTYAPTITTILGRDYVAREKRMLKPTELGTIVTDIMAENFSDIVDVDFTANMEQQLDNIEEGSEKWKDVIDRFYKPFKSVLEKAEAEIEKVQIKEEVSDEKCDKCGRNMVIKLGRFGKFLACPGFPECRNAKPILKDTGVKCPKCGARIVERRSQRGKKYFSCENAPKCDFILWDEPTKTPCPSCGGVMTRKYLKRGSVTVCSNPECDTNKKKEKGKE
ncbi:MAG: type I DNA topoisomerase [Ruminococcaceae bacterium]|nr:type I DNA topoisomerase [Oscillospiraceae bacterium]